MFSKLCSPRRPLDSDNPELPVYRFGSVGQDAHIFFWDLCEVSVHYTYSLKCATNSYRDLISS